MKIHPFFIAAYAVIFLTSGCAFPSGEKILTTGKDAIDLYDHAGPLITAIVETLQPTPTFGNLNPIKKYFVLASSQNCESIIDRVDNLNPSHSIVCRFTDETVRYDNWYLSTTMDEVHEGKLKSPGTQITNDTTWYTKENPEDKLGMLYEFLDNEGKANIIWTVFPDYQHLSVLSGWAFRADNNQTALFEWWANFGSDHN